MALDTNAGAAASDRHANVDFGNRAVERKREKRPLERDSAGDFSEGFCVQTLHIGPYCDEGPRIAAMHKFIDDQGYALRGKHHEIYMSDPRRTSPEKLKTILRQPVTKL